MTGIYLKNVLLIIIVGIKPFKPLFFFTLLVDGIIISYQYY